jgi:hypothetical protein
MSTKEDSAGDGRWAGMIAIVGFVFVATAQVTKKPFRLGPGVDRALYRAGRQRSAVADHPRRTA